MLGEGCAETRLTFLAFFGLNSTWIQASWNDDDDDDDSTMVFFFSNGRIHLGVVTVLLLTGADTHRSLGTDPSSPLLCMLAFHLHLLFLFQQLRLLHHLQQLVGGAGLEEDEVDGHRLLLPRLGGMPANAGQGGLLGGQGGGQVVLARLHQVAIVSRGQTFQSSPGNLRC